MIETKIYVGLNDSVTKTQLFSTDKYINILKNVCKAYQTAFSFDVEEGGYMHENGKYTMETSLILTLIDADKNVIREIARDLCAFFHQESVLITEDHVRAFYVKETLETE